MVERWQDWLGQIDNDVSTVYLYRAIWISMATTIDGNPTIPRTPVLGMIAISFGRLLTEIIETPSALTAGSSLPAGVIVDVLG